MDFVDEEDLAIAQIGKDGGEVAFDLQRRAGSLLEGGAEFVGDNVGERCFAEARRAVEKTWSRASPRDFAAWMAMSRFSLTLFWPMNSCRRCGRSFNSKEESSSTGAAETRRSLSGALSFAADTEGDGSSSVFRLLVDLELRPDLSKPRCLPRRLSTRQCARYR